jgi:hypothetical protein
LFRPPYRNCCGSCVVSHPFKPPMVGKKTEIFDPRVGNLTTNCRELHRHPTSQGLGGKRRISTQGLGTWLATNPEVLKLKIFLMIIILLFSLNGSLYIISIFIFYFFFLKFSLVFFIIWFFDYLYFFWIFSILDTIGILKII